MLDSDLEAFSAAWAGAWELSGKGITPAAIMLAFEVLRRYDLDAVTEALTRHATNPDTGQYPPKPADIVRYIDGGTEDRALLAWSKVEKAVRLIGPYMSVAFDDPWIHRALADMGGWILLGQKTDDEWPFVAREFQHRYRGYAQRGEYPAYPPTMIGISEAMNLSTGNAHSDETVLIGDPERVQRVIAGGSAHAALEFTLPAPNETTYGANHARTSKD